MFRKTLEHWARWPTGEAVGVFQIFGDRTSMRNTP